mgnify:CR=1 FL=1
MALSTAANAAPVSVVGGFTSFSGQVGAGIDFVTRINGNVICPGGDCSVNIGTASVTFAPPVSSVDFRQIAGGTLSTPNLLTFTPAPAQDVGAGQEFLLGTFTYTNGIWFDSPTFGFSLTSVSSDPALNGHIFSDSVRVTITFNDATNTPQQNADFFSFVGRPDLGSARAYELGDSPTGSNVLSWDVYGKIGSLIPTRFANSGGGGFLDPSVDVQPTVVPIPAAVWLLGSGLVGLVGIARRKVDVA